jgi:hypothetical protein
MFCPASHGGLGLYPFTLLGASADTICAFKLFSDPGLLHLANKALTPLQGRKSSVRQSIINAATRETGPFAAGISYFQKTRKKERKDGAAIAKVKLAQEGVKLGDLELKNHYKIAISSIVDAQRATNSRVFAADQASLYENAINSIGRMDEVLNRDYAWVEGLNVVLERSVFSHPWPCPSPCLDESWRRLIRRFGIAQRPVNDILNPSTFISKLKRGDPDAPRNLTPEGVYRAIVNPKILRNRENLRLAFIAMGFRASNASEVAGDIHKELSKFAFQQSASTYSYGDAFLPRLDRNNVIDDPITVTGFSNPIMTAIVREMVLMYTLLEGDAAGCEFRAKAGPKNDSDYHKVESSFSGKLGTPVANDYITLYGDSE